MNDETIEKLFDLFERNSIGSEKCEINLNEFHQRNLTINIESLIRDLSSDHWSTFFSLSNDRKEIHLNNPINICSNNSNQCKSCDSLHICLKYLLNKSCQEFNKTGQCFYSHSLFTKHNQKILEKYFLINSIRNLFLFFNRLFQLTNSQKDTKSFQNRLIVQHVDKKKFDETLIDQYLREYQYFLLSKTRLDPYTIELIFSDDEITFLMENILCQNHLKTIDYSKEKRNSTNIHQSTSAFVQHQRIKTQETLSKISSSNQSEISEFKNSFEKSSYSNVGRGRIRDQNSFLDSSVVLSETNSNQDQDKQTQPVLRKSFSTRLK